MKRRTFVASIVACVQGVIYRCVPPVQAQASTTFANPVTQSVGGCTYSYTFTYGDGTERPAGGGVTA